jgi:DNA-binding GntR family transcriptional regulator
VVVKTKSKTSKPKPFTSEKKRIYLELRKDILTLSLSPRELLVESALAERFGVSKAPVREALAILQRDGLVEALPRKGYLVTPITISDVHELFELRIALEGTAAELAANKITEEELGYLESLQPPLSPKRGPELEKFLDYNRKFHLAVARASRNARLARLIEQTAEEMERAIAASYEIGEHMLIVDALRARDPARARVAMIQHIRGAESRALHWEASGPPSTLQRIENSHPRR